MKYLYKYPQAEYPYAQLVEENRRRSSREPEYELLDTGVFDENRYFDVFVEYAKASPEDVLIEITAFNRGPEAATLDLLPTVWFRNTWSWKPDRKRPLRGRRAARADGPPVIVLDEGYLGRRYLHTGDGRGAALHRERDERRAPLRLAQSLAVRQGRVPRVRHPRATATRSTRAARDQGRRAPSLHDSGREAPRASACA